MIPFKNTSIILLTFLILLSFFGQSFAGLEDRAFATHNVNQVGYFTTNIGQFYPYGGQFEKTLEYPINSGHICIYRQCIMVGVPVNVISAADGRFEEFDAIGGFDAGNAELAISDNPNTWPSWGWPIQDDQGNPIILGQQTSFCAYSDSTNWRYNNNNELDKLLNFQINQTIYSWGVSGFDKMHIVKFEIQNKSAQAYEDMYFNFYSDIDIGGIDNTAREWADDCIDFDRDENLVYFYDSDDYSNDWGEPNPFLSGVVFLETPNNLGITDFHWIDVTIDEVAVNSAHWDSVSYYLMNSDTTYFHEHPDLQVSDFFHLGENPIDGTHYDDPLTTRITDGDGNVIGGPMVAYICNGPFNIQPGEQATIIVGVVVGDDENDLYENVGKAKEAYDKGFRLASVPPPVVEAEGRNREVQLFWDNDLDVNYINEFALPPVNDLEGYIVYRTTDQSLNDWLVLDTIPMLYKNETTVTPRKYAFTDTNSVFNGFDYIYSVTAYSHGPGGDVIESVRLRGLDNIANLSNSVLIQPSSLPAQMESDLDKIRVVPNPFVISAQWDAERLGNYAFGEPVRNIAFTNLPSNCTIKVFTIDGDLIKTIEHVDQTGREEWNLLSSENRPIVSGIYFFHVNSDVGEKVGRFAVIR